MTLASNASFLERKLLVERGTTRSHNLGRMVELRVGMDGRFDLLSLTGTIYDLTDGGVCYPRPLCEGCHVLISPSAYPTLISFPPQFL